MPNVPVPLKARMIQNRSYVRSVSTVLDFSRPANVLGEKIVHISTSKILEIVLKVKDAATVIEADRPVTKIEKKCAGSI